MCGIEYICRNNIKLRFTVYLKERFELHIWGKEKNLRGSPGGSPESDCRSRRFRVPTPQPWNLDECEVSDWKQMVKAVVDFWEGILGGSCRERSREELVKVSRVLTASFW
ncbi:hypothetical protein FHG87_016691 [Trinorchestia longiramus]|nr:hypothetical protein FHG87_016691 [Trinorchestia longiramus]